MRITELFGQTLNEEGMVVLGVNTTQDVSPGEIKRQAAKLALYVDDNGIPPTIRSDGLPPNTKSD